MKLKYFTWIPAFLVACIIFQFSSNTGSQSSGLSGKITAVILEIGNSVRSEPMSQEEYDILFSKTEHIVRKMAHAGEYGLLSVCVGFHLLVLQWRRKKIILSSIIICFLYACTDEFHQLFIEGRAGQFKDVCIDTAGATAGILLFVLLIETSSRLRSRKL